MATIIISDIHLGSPTCQAKKLLDFLSAVSEGTAKRLIINGDLFDCLNFTRLCKNQWKILSTLRKMSDKIELIWIKGNHDIGAELVANLIGAKLVDRYCVNDTLILHGDQFDDFLTKNPKLVWIADKIYWFLQRLNLKLARLAKYQSKTFLRCSDLVADRAIKYAKGYTYVCCGHTHHAMIKGYYYNSGCWTEDECHYLLIQDGKVFLESWS